MPLVFVVDAGLRKDTFYTSPYLTCEECNGLVYVDASALRNRIDLKQFEEDWETGERNEGIVLPPEPLPPCPGCGRTNTFRIGAEDLTLLLASNLEELERKKRVQKRMAKKVRVAEKTCTRDLGAHRRYFHT